MIAPHTGQSSQVFPDADDGNAQFRPNLAGAVVWHTWHRASKSLDAAQSGQSSQLAFTATAQMLSFCEQLIEAV
jgi:hypothetical protein